MSEANEVQKIQSQNEIVNNPLESEPENSEDSKEIADPKKSKKSKSKVKTKNSHKKSKAKQKNADSNEENIPEEQKTYNVYEEDGALVVEITSKGEFKRTVQPEENKDEKIGNPTVPPEIQSANETLAPAKSHKKQISKAIKRKAPESSIKENLNQDIAVPESKSENLEKPNSSQSIVKDDKIIESVPIQKNINYSEEIERKEAVIAQLKRSKQECLDDLTRLREQIGKKLPQSTEEIQKAHWDYLLKEMDWMAKDFDRERKSKTGNAKKLVRSNQKFLSERNVLLERYEKQKKLEAKKNANMIGKMIQNYWKSLDKIVKHNYNVMYEHKKQEAREKRLKNFVSKHLKLSEKVAEELKSKTGVYSYHPISQNEYENEPVLMDEQYPEEVSIFIDREDSGYVVSDTKIVNGKAKKLNINGNEENKEEGKYDIRAIAESVAEIAKSAQPTGFTLSTSKVSVKVPFLLKHSLREYQIIGLDWLVTLHDRKLNGILADEMGLGKTIQTISLLASLAVEKGIWGPHLIVVPTTIIINWEMEFKKWCPAFKVITYFGSQRERKQKRTGWSRENAFHICITSYKLVIQDHFAFRRKKWYYMILDEAQNIKNFRSQRWQLLLRFNTRRRLLLTGTPLQNDVMELWSLMHFLMPQIFASHEDFKEWFFNPFAQSINSNAALNLAVVKNLQSILRPFLLRRLKRDVEKQLPEKVEHIVYCNLSRRQRFLYDEYINAEHTQKTLQNSSDFFSIMNVLMQLRKVCNHPDLFESRHIDSPFTMRNYLDYTVPSLTLKARDYQPMTNVNLSVLQLMLSEINSNMSQLEYNQLNDLLPQKFLTEAMQQIFQYPQWAYSYCPTREGLANCDKFKTGNLLLKKPNISSKDFPTHPMIGSYFSLPPYLSPTNVPYVSSEFSLNSAHELYKANYRPTAQSNKRPENDPNKTYKFMSQLHYSYYSYKNALTELEQIFEANEQFDHLKTIREYDYLNRMKILFSKPVYGKDLRKAVKVPQLVSNLYQKQVKYGTGEIPSSIFNPAYKSGNQIVSQCSFTDLENNEIPMNCSVALECTARKLGERRKPKKVQTFLFDPSNYSECDLLGEYAGDEKKLCITIDLDLLYGNGENVVENNNAMQIIEPENENEVNKNTIKIQFGKPETEQKMEDFKLDNPQQNQPENKEEQKITAELPQTNTQAEPQKTNTQLEEIKTLEVIEEVKEESVEKTENSIISGEEEESYSSESQNVQRKNLLSDISDNDNSEPFASDDNNEQEENKQNLNSLGRYLTRSKVRTLENKSQPEQKEDVSNMVTVELIPKKYLEMLDHQNDVIQEELEEMREQIPLTEEEIKADEGKFFAYRYTDAIKEIIKQPNQRQKEMHTILRQFKVIQPKALGVGVKLWPSSASTIYRNEDSFFTVAYRRLMSAHFVQRALRIGNFLTFPDRRLIQYDSGKLQKMSLLLKKLKAQNSKVLIFTQMSKMLDIVECFLNLHGYTYVRLDGSIKVEIRQQIVDRFNNDPRIFCFISSTRCGGIGINLTAADAVIFYDSDWNPAMDKQAQDRCHRIGQTKTVHIYRLITLNTIEENIFKKSLQKREIGGLIMEDGQFDTDFFKKIDFKEVVEEEHLIKRSKPANILVKENIRIDTTLQESSNNKQGENQPKNPADEVNSTELVKKLEDALIVVEDKEDVEAANNAKREIVDEFEFDENENKNNAENNNTAQPENQQKPVQKKKDDNGITELKKNELIDWENDTSIISVTKKSLEFYQKLNPYDEFFSQKAGTDKRFVQEEPEENEENKNEDEKNENNSEESESQSVISDTECDELPETVKLEALAAYKEATQKVLMQKPVVNQQKEEVKENEPMEQVKPVVENKPPLVENKEVLKEFFPMQN